MNMRTRILINIAAACMGCLLFAGHAQSKEVTDLAGRTVTIPDHPQRVLLGEGRFVFAMALLDRDNPVQRVVGWQGELKRQDPFAWVQLITRYPDAAKVPLIGTTSEASVSPEKVVSLQPDVAIFSVSGHGPGRNSPMISALKDAGIPVVFIDFRQKPLQNTVASMRILGQVLGREKEAQEYNDFYQERLARVQALVRDVPQDKKPTVFVEMLAGVWPACCHTTGDGNFGEMVEAAGGKNIAKGVLPSAIGDVSMEFLIKQQPEIYIATGSRSEAGRPGLLIGPGATADMSSQSLSVLLQRDGIRQLNAVEQGRSYGIWHAFYNSPYNIVAIEAFAKWFYPKRAANIDPEASLNALYTHFVKLNRNGIYWTTPATNPSAHASK
jgi:iron complex transport system substrate-binding protein